jgi:hypothetical protein
VVARRGEVATWRQRLTLDREVDENALETRLRRKYQRDRSGSVRAHRRVQVLVVRKVVTHDDQVRALFVLLVEVTHGTPVSVQAPKSRAIP